MAKLVSEGSPTSELTDQRLQRTITWKDGLWIVSGILPSVLLSIGAMATTLGPPSWIVWAIATIIALAHLLIYAEMSGMFPNHSGGASVFAAIAWQRYGKIFAPISIWCNWLGWSVSPAIAALIAGSYIISGFFANTAIAKFSWTILDLSAILPGITFKLNGAILAALAILLISFFLQHSGVLRMARVQFLMAVFSIVPLGFLTLFPLVLGKINWSNFTPFLLEGTTTWFDRSSLSLLIGGLYIAIWSTFSCEAALCYVSEFKNPEKDTPLVVLWSGALAAIAFIGLPFTFLGVLGMETLRDPAMVAGDAQVGIVRMADLTFGVGLGRWLTVLLILAMMLTIVTCMAGSSRTLYQSSLEGWLPKYLAHLNSHGVPTRAMWTDIVINIVLLCLGSPLFILAATNVVYLTGVVLNLIAAWIHRRDRPHHPRPYRAPNWMINIGVPALALFDIGLIIFGANVFVPNSLLYGLIALLLVIPVFYYRHYIVDKGIWPQAAQEDLGIERSLP